MKRHLGTSLGILLAFFLFVEPVCAEMVLIYGIDETGSYSFREKALALGGKIISEMKPGDVFYARRITHSSYSDDCNILRLALPEVGDPPQNKFDRRARYQWEMRMKTVEGLKAQACNSLVRLPPVRAKMTDIWGFFAAASDRFRTECRGDCHKVIVIASDMKDNCNREIAMDLKGVRVMVVGFESGGDPKLARKIVQGWTNSLKKYGVSDVEFLPPDCPLTINSQLKEVQAR